MNCSDLAKSYSDSMPDLFWEIFHNDSLVNSAIRSAAQQGMTVEEMKWFLILSLAHDRRIRIEAAIESARRSPIPRLFT